MQHNPHHAMNGYHPNNGASTSSYNYDHYPASHSTQPVHFNNNHPPTHNHQRQQQSQPIPQSPSQMQWSHGMQMNGQHQPMSPQHRPPPFNQPPWGNPMPPLASFPNNVNAMPGFNMNFIPQQVIQEAYALSVAVSASDEPTLVSKLLSSRKRGESYKEALNSLHAVGGHSASLWKDYYLDHKDRIDAWIAMCLQKDNDKSSISRDDLSNPASSERGQSATIKGTAKKPSFKQESPPSVSTRIVTSAPPVKLPKKLNQSTSPLPIEQSSNNRRNTINSLTAPTPVFGNRLPAPNADIKIPDPPLRSPSPPTNIIPHRGRGNKYTPEDRDFFIKFIGWRLKQDPSLTRQDICDMLAEKAPHHSVQSWASYWSNNHDIPDKILAAARGIEETEGSDSEEEEENGPPKPRPKYKDITTSEEESRSEEESQSESEDESNQKPLRRWTEDEMGEKGGPFTDADDYIAAKYIASFPELEEATPRERWGPFHDRHPQRSVKSWVEYYRRNGSALQKLAKRIRKEESNPAASSIYTQCARPTLAPIVKRKHVDSDDDDDDDDDEDSGRPKRGRPSKK